MPDKTQTIRMDPHIESLPVLLDRLEVYAQALALPPKIAHRLSLVCEEFVANTAMHGGAAASYVEVTVTAQAGELHVSIVDDGAAFDPLAAATPDTTLPLEARKIGGLGIHFALNMTKNLRYTRHGACNHVTIVLDMHG